MKRVYANTSSFLTSSPWNTQSSTLSRHDACCLSFVRSPVIFILSIYSLIDFDLFAEVNSSSVLCLRSFVYYPLKCPISSSRKFWKCKMSKFDITNYILKVKLTFKLSIQTALHRLFLTFNLYKLSAFLKIRCYVSYFSRGLKNN